MKIFNPIRQLIVIGIFSLFCNLAYADDAGQIINVNQNFKIAFTDLGSRVLKPNDIVKVFISPDEFLYMKVLECSPILSKLGPVQEEAFKTILQDLPRVSVGNPVVKLTVAPQEETSPPATNMESKAEPESAPKIDTYKQTLEQELIDARAEIKSLKEANAALETKINDFVMKIQIKEAEVVTTPPAPHKTKDENLKKIKSQLEKMQRLMDQK